MLVKSMLVPDVDATEVPDVITLEAIELMDAPVIVGLVSVLFVSVCVSVVPTTAPAGLPTPPAGNVTPDVPLIVVAIVIL
jgi:hypothetical protein